MHVETGFMSPAKGVCLQLQVTADIDFGILDTNDHQISVYLFPFSN